ncbi:hypothetical protein BD769DRAFT_1490288, partial [Suillus cothurnatus]
MESSILVLITSQELLSYLLQLVQALKLKCISRLGHEFGRIITLMLTTLVQDLVRYCQSNLSLIDLIQYWFITASALNQDFNEKVPAPELAP